MGGEVDKTKLANRILSSVAFGLAMLVVVFFYHMIMEVKTGHRFVLDPLEYVTIFASNGFLAFLLQVSFAYSLLKIWNFGR